MGMLTASTTAQDVLAHFNITEGAAKEYQDWRTNRRYRELVVPCLMDHRAEVVYQLTPRSVAAACEATADRRRGGHALAHVRKADAERVVPVRDWNPAFAFSHVFHWMVEQHGQIPTWPEFTGFINRDPAGYRMLGEAVVEIKGWLVQQYDDTRQRCYSEEEIEDAVQWRLGNAYYSFLREMHVLTYMRAHGMDVCVHPLADTLFRVDAWWGRTNLSIYIGNDRYRHNHEGRKKEAERILDGAPVPFLFESLNLPRATGFGKVYLASEKVLDHRMGDLRSSSI